VIPTNAGDRGSIVLKAGQKVMVLKSPKGIYMQLESGKIIAIRTSANNKPNSPALPGQTFSSQQQQPQPQPQLNQPSTIAYNRPQSLESSFNSGPKNGD
jgi:RAD54-like protein 2